MSNTKPHALALFEAGEGEPVLVLHGQLSTHKSLQEVTELLKEHRHVYMVDLLGYGDSPRPHRAAYSVEQHVNSIYETIQKKHIKTPITILGHSMGAQLALALARTYPEVVKNVVVTALPLFDSPDSGYGQMAKTDPEIAWVLRGKRARILRSLPRITEGVLSSVAVRINKGKYPLYASREAARSRWPAFHRSMENVVIGYSPLKDIKEISAPILFMFGDSDAINPDAAKKLAPVIRSNHKIEIVKGTHHMPQEHAELITKRVLQV